MKIKLILILFITLFVTSCSFKGNSGKIKKEIEVDELKRDGLTTVSETLDSAPNINFVNKLKPRRELSSSTNRIQFPNFPISINFVNTDLQKALSALGKIGGRNILVGDGVDGVLNYSVSNEPWNEILNAIIDMNGLGYKGDPSTGMINIYGGANSGSQAVVTEIFNIYYEKPSVVKAQIQAIMVDAPDPVAGAANPPAALTLIENDENKTLIAKGSSSDLNQIETILNKIDVKKPQVLIEAFLLEVSPSFETKLGSRIGATRQVTNAQGVTETIRGLGGGGETGTITIGGDDSSISNFLVDGKSGLGIMRSVGSKTLKVEIDALETEGDSRILSNPKIFTISGKKALIKQGTQFGVTETTTSAAGTTTSATKYYDANLQLDVTPIITGDGNVIMEVKITNDSVDLSLSPPKITKKEITTNLILSDGDIAVIGGIITDTLSETNTRTPGFGKLPGIGALFRSRVQKDENTELLIFIAPRIV